MIVRIKMGEKPIYSDFRIGSLPKMEFQDVQQVCLNGHQITASYNRDPHQRKDFCDQCGRPTIHKCPACDNEIKGKLHREHLVSNYRPPVPSHCEKCGKPFPWTESRVPLYEAVLERWTTLLDEPSAIRPLLVVETICSRFHLVVMQLCIRHNNREAFCIKDEYDVQDLLHALLHIHFDDIRPEESTPSHVGASSRTDFLLKNEQIVIEVKKTRATLTTKQLGNELIIDINRYRVHPDCKTLICFVYDPDHLIRNPRGFEKDLSSEMNGFLVKVLVRP